MKIVPDVSAEANTRELWLIGAVWNCGAHLTDVTGKWCSSKVWTISRVLALMITT